MPTKNSTTSTIIKSYSSPSFNAKNNYKLNSVIEILPTNSICSFVLLVCNPKFNSLNNQKMINEKKYSLFSYSSKLDE